jgi:FkbM family methyltransferase
LDVGGHFGQYAVLFAALAGEKGRVVTFEPDVGAHATLRRNLELNGFQDRVRVESIALFDVAGEHEFYSRGADSMSSLALSGLGANAAKPDVQRQSVSTVTLDDYLRPSAGRLPDIMKIDTEGAEVHILRGGLSFLKSGKGTIVCELHPYAWKEFGTSFEELLGLIRGCGREARYLDPSLKIEDGAVYGAIVIT